MIKKGSSHGDVTNVLETTNIVHVFEQHFLHYVQFWTNSIKKGINPFIAQARLNCTTTVLLQGYHWQGITHKG